MSCYIPNVYIMIEYSQVAHITRYMQYYCAYGGCHGICIFPIHLEIQFLLSFLTLNDFTLRCRPNLLTKTPLFHFVPIIVVVTTNGHETWCQDSVKVLGRCPKMFALTLLLLCGMPIIIYQSINNYIPEYYLYRLFVLGPTKHDKIHSQSVHVTWC